GTARSGCRPAAPAPPRGWKRCHIAGPCGRGSGRAVRGCRVRRRPPMHYGFPSDPPGVPGILTHREDGRRQFLTQNAPPGPIRLRIGRRRLSFSASTERRMINSGVTVAREALAALSRFTGATRLYALDLQDCPTELVVERWQGHEALSSGFEWWVDVLSTDAHLPLEPMIGRRATLWTRMADGGRLPRSGLVREAACLGGDGGLARYRLCLVPWTWLLGQGRHSRVFQDMTVLEILAEVLAGYAPLARWQVADEVGPARAAEGLPAPARLRSYWGQYGESDADFIARLLAEEGLGWRLEEVPGDDGGEPGHQMVVFSDSAAGPRDPSCPANGALRLHRYDGAERSDAIQILGQRESLGPGQLTVLTDDYRHQVLSASAALEACGEGHRLEAYDFAGPYAFATQTEGARYAGLMAEASEASRHAWKGRGTVRSFRAGEWFRVAAP